MSIRIVAAERQAAVVDRILGTLPEWFGIEESNAEYVRDGDRLPALLAVENGRDHDAPGEGEVIGILLYARHFPETGEIHLIAVHRSHLRRGAGRAMVEALQALLRADGAALMSVKTLGPSHPDVNYAGTREFYRSLGFLPVEEMLDLWPGNPCLIMVKPL